ncbi:hypothetical protein [Mycoplasma ovis]|nr:hypothetical protein [Mycoplasma ovis]
MALYSSQYKYLFVALGVGVSLAGTFVQKSGLLPNSMVKAQEETTNVGTEEETQVQIAKTHLKQTTDSSGENQHEFAEPNEETETHVDEVKNREKSDNPARVQASEIRETTGEPILPDKGWEVNRIQEDTLIPTPETKPLTIKVKEPPVQSAQIKEASLKEEIHEIVSDDTEEDKKVLTENHIPSKTSTSFGKNWFSMNAEASSITEEGYEWSINDCV